MKALENRKYLSVKEAADDYFDKLISVSTLYHLINEGKIKVIKLGNKILIPISELNNYCNKALGGINNEAEKNNDLYY
ncbi:MAG: helix-turn-helix domain-containing protein [Clostridioides difficile]|nr:helix-turn-helix domain-containing protein [Clostridioides difficile]